ncbi:MAG: prolipoprotein diacylglyceryl transferase [Proteobacteria bacterium]|nr:prolipoprotein diacylglyceryl transferase [Pseudomonadota bacterium]
MYPIIFEIGSFSLRGYGLMVAVGFIVGIWFAAKEAERVGVEKGKVIDLAFYTVLAAIIGSRVLHVIIEWDYFSKNPVEIIKIWRGGLVFYGGLIGAILVGWLYIIKHKMPFWKTTDICVLVIPLGHAFGRLGCFAAGCCHGKITDLPWAVKFTDPESLAPLNVHIHPTQLYSSINNLAIFALLMFLRKRKKFEGQLALTYLFVYSITRGIIEFWRGDDRGVLFFGIFSAAQGIGVILALMSIVGMIYLSKRKENKTS